ncbi:MAG: helix-turn-helix transcriptional regulator [Rhodocyclaceae bacterium]|nr:helix-turn-helix transcriptional regulator [Rhodocyclaceae bacterium]
MSTTHDMIEILKAELKLAGLTYAALAKQLGIAESSVKRMFSAAGDMPLSRVDAICRVLKLDFADLSRSVAEREPLISELSLAQEQAVVADRQLLLVAICCLSRWSLDQIVATYRLSEPECIRALVRLDRLGVIDLRPDNRYHLKLAKGFRWRPHGPVMGFFRSEVIDDYFAGGFDGASELLMVVNGQIGCGQAEALRERLARVAHDFAQQHIADQKLPAGQRRPYTVVIGMRSWLMAAFRDLMRPEAQWPPQP